MDSNVYWLPVALGQRQPSRSCPLHKQSPHCATPTERTMSCFQTVIQREQSPTQFLGYIFRTPIRHTHNVAAQRDVAFPKLHLRGGGGSDEAMEDDEPNLNTLPSIPPARKLFRKEIAENNKAIVEENSGRPSDQRLPEHRRFTYDTVGFDWRDYDPAEQTMLIDRYQRAIEAGETMERLGRNEITAKALLSCMKLQLDKYYTKLSEFLQNQNQSGSTGTIPDDLVKSGRQHKKSLGSETSDQESDGVPSLSIFPKKSDVDDRSESPDSSSSEEPGYDLNLLKKWEVIPAESIMPDFLDDSLAMWEHYTEASGDDAFMKTLGRSDQDMVILKHHQLGIELNRLQRKIADDRKEKVDLLAQLTDKDKSETELGRELVVTLAEIDGYLATMTASGFDGADQSQAPHEPRRRGLNGLKEHKGKDLQEAIRRSMKEQQQTSLGKARRESQTARSDAFSDEEALQEAIHLSLQENYIDQ